MSVPLSAKLSSAMALTLMAVPLPAPAQSDAAPAATAQNAATVAAPEPLEGLPPHLAAIVERNEAALAAPALTNVERSVVEDLALWDLSAGPIKVCFIEGDIALKRKIMKAALEWQVPGSAIRFDFGPPANPQMCDRNSFSHIRIGFRYKGYWSLIGQHNVVSARQDEQSMNFEGWDVRDVSDAVLRRIVLHEFGHAIGFRHELQNPFSVCEQEFDWPYVYADLKKAPNGWSPAEVDRQMRRILTGSVSATAVDRESIMIYALKAEYFRTGTASPCYQTERNALSPIDIATVKAKYPTSIVAQIGLRQTTFRAFETALKGKNLASDVVASATSAALPFSPSINVGAKLSVMDSFQKTSNFR